MKFSFFFQVFKEKSESPACHWFLYVYLKPREPMHSELQMFWTVTHEYILYIFLEKSMHAKGVRYCFFFFLVHLDFLYTTVSLSSCSSSFFSFLFSFFFVFSSNSFLPLEQCEKWKFFLTHKQNKEHLLPVHERHSMLMVGMLSMP